MPRLLLPAGALVALLALALVVAVAPPARLSHASGWLLLGALVTVAGLLGKQLRGHLAGPSSEVAEAAIDARPHLAACALAIACFAGHTGLRLPRGLLEIVLASIFALVAASGVLGALVAGSIGRRGRPEGADPGDRHRSLVALHRRLLLVHVPFLVCLLPVALLHGALGHGHAFLAGLVAGGGP